MTGSALEWFLDHEDAFGHPVYATPWGQARPLSFQEIGRIQRRGGRMRKADLCVMYRDRLEIEGRDPRQAMDGAIALVRRESRLARRRRP